MALINRNVAPNWLTLLKKWCGPFYSIGHKLKEKMTHNKTTNNHALILRFHYEKDDPRFAWRLNYFKMSCLPRILAQTSQNFDIWIRCYKWHEAEIKALSPRINTFQVKNEGARYKQHGKRKYFHDFVPWSDVIGLPKYDIQSGLDTDDLIEPDYIKMIEKSVAEHKAKYPGKSLHLSFQPKLFTLSSHKITPMRKYAPKRPGSAFFSIYQPNKFTYLFAYQESHITLGANFDRSITLPDGYCFATAHSINESTGK